MNVDNKLLSYISEKVNMGEIDRTKFNLIASGTGTGKSTFIIKDLLGYFPDVDARDIIFVTSRAMIVEQQSREKGIDKLYKNNFKLIDYWNGERESKEINKSNINIMTYDVLIDIIKKNDFINHDALENVKIIIFDECHTIFSDNFIKDIEMLKIWSSFMIKKGKKVFLGLTATPHILYYAVQNNMWGVEINQLNDKILINYKIKQLICTDFNTIPYLIMSNTLKGRTLIMCYTVEDCYKLKKQIPNSAVLISKNNKLFDKNMKSLRDYIIKNANLPNTYIETIKDVDEEKPLKVLITTSTLREGINIQSVSNVKNVISCFSDDLHIIQFAGRCRHDLDFLVVADTYIRSDNLNQNKYLLKKRQQFKDFLYSNDIDSKEWFESIGHIIDHSMIRTIKIKFDKGILNFINYMNDKWLIPLGVQERDINNYYIYKPQDKEEIIKQAVKNKIFTTRLDKVTFNRIMDFMKYSLGYKIDEGRIRTDGRRLSYRLIVNYDKDRGNFHYVDNRINGDEEDYNG